MPNRSLTQIFTLVSAFAVAGLSSLSLLGYARAYQQVHAFTGADIEWSGFIVPLGFMLFLFTVSVVGALGVLFGPSRHQRAFATVFLFGVLAAICGRWVAVALGVLRAPGAAAVVVSLLAFAWFAFLAAALRSNSALDRTP